MTFSMEERPSLGFTIFFFQKKIYLFNYNSNPNKLRSLLLGIYMKTAIISTNKFNIACVVGTE